MQGGPGSIPGRGTRSHMHAATKKFACCNWKKKEWGGVLLGQSEEALLAPKSGVVNNENLHLCRIWCGLGIVRIILFFLIYFFKIICFIYFFLILFIYLWLCWVFVSVRGLSLVAASGGHSSSRCAGLSLLRPLLLRSTGSRRTGSAIVAHGPSRSAACGIFPDQGSNPCPLHWQADSQPVRHQGNPESFYMY